MLAIYSKFLDKLETLEKILLAASSAAVMVILRYCFNASNSWSEELARYLFIYDVMLAASIAIRKNSHLQVDFLINLLKPKQKAAFTSVATVLGIVFLGFLFSYSLTLCTAAGANISPGIKVSMAVPYASMPIGVVLMILTSIEVVLKNLAFLYKGIDKEAGSV